MSCSDSVVFQCKPGDSQRILKLANQIWKPTFAPILPHDRLDYLFDFMYKAEKIEKALSDVDQAFFVLEQNGFDVGYAQLVFSPEKVKLEKLYLLPALQGVGCGLYLLRWLTNYSVQRGLDRMSLQVNRGNHKAIRFYEKFGFRVIASKDFDVGGGHVMDDYIMECDLQTNALH